MNQKVIDTLRQVSRQLVRELGMLQWDQSEQQETPAYWHALIEIAQEPGITQATLGKRLLLSTATMSRLIQRLEKQKLVKIAVGLDKREKQLSITPAGLEALKKIDDFSADKIKGAFEFMKAAEIKQLIDSISLYANALEKSRQKREQMKILTLSTSRTLRKQVVNMITQIQRDEFGVPVTDEINACVLQAEGTFCYHNACNFWYAVDAEGKVIGSVGLKKVDEQHGEIKKFFVVPEYRGKGLAQQLMAVVAKAAHKHGFGYLVLGTVDILKGAQKFYQKCGFKPIAKKALPKNFEACPLDTVFFKAKTSQLNG